MPPREEHERVWLEVRPYGYAPRVSRAPRGDLARSIRPAAVPHDRRWSSPIAAPRPPPREHGRGLRRAADLGADSVELDARRTADGQLIVHHDAQLPDGRAIVDLAAADLPTSVPSLAEALDACAGMGVNIEIKNWPPTTPTSTRRARRRRGGRGAAAPRAADLPGRGILISSFSRPTRSTASVELDAHVADRTPCSSPTAEGPSRRLVADVAGGGHEALHPWDGLVTARPRGRRPPAEGPGRQRGHC